MRVGWKLLCLSAIITLSVLVGARLYRMVFHSIPPAE